MQVGQQLLNVNDYDILYDNNICHPKCQFNFENDLESLNIIVTKNVLCETINKQTT